MIAFVAAATALVALALGILLLPFLRAPRGGAQVSLRGTHLSVLRDQVYELERDHAAGLIDDEQLVQSRTDVERMAADELRSTRASTHADASSGIGVAMALAIALPAFVLAAYALRGGWPGAPSGAAPVTASAEAAGEAHEDVNAMIAKLEARLRSEPDNAEGWFLLARSYHSAGRFADAVSAYERADRLAPNDPDLLADYADTVAMAQNRKLAGKPVELVRRALAARPDHVKSLLLAGSAAFEVADYRGAADYWERATRVTQAGTDFGDVARNALADARARLGESPAGTAAAPPPSAVAAGAPAPETGTTTASAGASTVEGMVSLNPAIAGRAGPDDVVFVIARAVKGPPMPLAVKRFKVRDLPARFSVSDADAMMPALTLSKAAEIVMVARVSRSGEPKAASGDLEGSSVPLKPPRRDVAIEISRVVP